jgi:hypothetical protein
MQILSELVEDYPLNQQERRIKTDQQRGFTQIYERIAHKL